MMFGIPIEGATGIYYVSLAVLVFVLWLSREHAAPPARPRHGGDPRQRDLRAEHGHPSRAVQDVGLRHQRRHDWPRRRAVRALRALPGARTRSTCCCRCSSSPSSSSAASGRCTAPSWARCSCACCRRLIAIVRDDLPFGIGRHAGAGAVAVRAGPGAGDPVRAGRHLRTAG